jgi:L-ribulose-5-phosphate 3-epimerase
MEDSMTFKTGVLLDSFQLPLEDTLRISSESGADGVQMYAVPHHMASLDLDYKAAKSLKRKVESYNLQISALCGDIGGHGFEIENENSGKIKKTREIIDFAVELGTGIITTHIGVISETDKEKNIIMQEALKTICQYAEKSGVYIAIETGPEKSLLLKKFIEETGENNLKVNLDPANLLMVQGENPAEVVLNLKDYIVYTHAKDGRMLSRCDPAVIYGAFAEGNPEQINFDNYFMELPLGDGDVNFQEYLKTLNDIGYSGYLTIEREAGNNRIKDITEGLSFLKNIMP